MKRCPLSVPPSKTTPGAGWSSGVGLLGSTAACLFSIFKNIYLHAGKHTQQICAGRHISIKCDLILRVNSIVERSYFFSSGPSVVLSLGPFRYRQHCRDWSRGATHSTAGVSATMMLLMNYKQTLRPSTFVPVASGLQPGDKWLPAQKTRTHIHTVPLSPIACLLTVLIYITTAWRQVTSAVTPLPCFHLRRDSL